MDPLAEKYYSISPYAYCLNNPVKYVDPDGRDIRLNNIVKYNRSGNPAGYEGSLSPKTETAMKDIMKTAEGVAYFAQFAKVGDVVGGHKFTKDGSLSDVTLTLTDYSFSDENGNIAAIPGSGSHIVFDDKKNVDIVVVSYGTDKFTTGETIVHETQVHGYKVENSLKGKVTTTETQDHKALKNSDTNHQGYKQYKSVQDQLQKIDENYKRAFEEVHRDTYSKKY